MRKTLTLLFIVVALGAGATIAEAQQPKKVPRIGYLSSQEPALDSTRSEGIRLAREADRRHDSAERLG